MENIDTKWSDLLKEAVTQPGMILKAYSAFHGYSMGNQLMAMLRVQLKVGLKHNKAPKDNSLIEGALRW